MENGFLDFLKDLGLITKEQTEKVLDSVSKSEANYELIGKHFFCLDEDQVNIVKSSLDSLSEESFVVNVDKLGYSNDVQMDLFKKEIHSTDFTHAQIICNMGFLSAEDVDGYMALFYIEDTDTPEDLIILPDNSEELVPEFVEHYAQIMLGCFQRKVYADTKYEGFTIVKRLSSEAVVCQKIIANHSLMLGIIADYQSINEFITNFHKESGGYDSSILYNNEYNIDFMCEFLNNSNSSCTYKFNIDFDLGVPEHNENSSITADKIYKLDYSFGSNKLSVIVIYGDNYYFRKSETAMKVLIVDDSRVLRAFVKSMLQDWDCEIFEAENGLEGYDSYFSCKPDIVFLDITMPILNGIECLKKIREGDPHAKIIMLTSNAQKSKIEEAISYGALSYLLKPLSKDEFNRALDNAFK